MKILSLFGTRPEAIKMVPLLKCLEADSRVESIVCVTGQHRAMLSQVLDLFNIKADFDLDIMQPDQTLNSMSARLIVAIDEILQRVAPDRVLVHGDTTTAMAGALAAFHRRIPVGHVEAGLRTNDLSQPFPEEMNRRVIDIVSDMLFAPTALSKNNLEAENLSGRIFTTGNTVVDALHLATRRIDSDQGLRAQLDRSLPPPAIGRKVLLVTGHRRENFGSGFINICSALAKLAQRDDLQIIFPVHLNPNVRAPVLAMLSHAQNIHLIEPLDYLHFVRLMQRSHIILTDSGGVQEEAPALGIPVLVVREVTERPEAVAAGTVRLVGTDSEQIVAGVTTLLENDAQWRDFSHRHNPYGDGNAARRIVAMLLGDPTDEFLSVPASRTASPQQSVGSTTTNHSSSTF